MGIWPFKKIASLKDSGMFEGFTDWHSHILPGVDDGIKTLDDSISVLKRFDELGIKKVWLTPHIMEDYPNETEVLRQKFEDLSNAWTGKTELRLASENMLDALFEERLEKRDFLPIGEDGNHLLVETSYFTPPFNLEGILEKIFSAGYFPILAHPERYRYMEEEDYKRLRDMGLKFQLNYVSLVGGYGDTAQKKAEWLLSHDMIDLLGGDLHRLDSVNKFLEQSPRKKTSSIV